MIDLATWKPVKVYAEFPDEDKALSYAETLESPEGLETVYVTVKKAA